MAYNPTQWVDHLTEYPNRWTMVPNADGTVTLTPAFGEVVQAGTPISAANMNKIEQGIVGAVSKSGDTMTGPLTIEATHITVDNIGNVHYWLKVNGENKGLLFYDANTKRLNLRIYTSQTGFRELSLYEDGSISAAGATFHTLASYFNRGVYFDSESYNDHIRLQRSGAEVGITITGSSFRVAPVNGIERMQFGNHNVWHYGDLRWNAAGYLEYNDGGTWRPVAGVKSVQRGVTSNTGSDVSNVPISTINRAKAFVNSPNLHTAWDADSGYGTKGFRMELTSNTNLRITGTSSQAGTSRTMDVAWEIIEYY